MTALLLAFALATHKPPPVPVQWASPCPTAWVFPEFDLFGGCVIYLPGQSAGVLSDPT